MPKEIYLYTSLYNYSAVELMQAITENMGKECTILENCYGGDVFSTMGINAKLKEHGNVTISVMGAAFSGGFNLLMYAKRVKALSTARFLIHRADGYASTPEQKALLNDMNRDLRAQMEKRVDASKLLAMKGVSLDAIFNPEARIDLFLSASEMKELGMVDEIIELSPQEIKAHEEMMFRIAANYNPGPTQENRNENPKPQVMTTLAELKEKYPLIYALAIEEGRKAGVEAETDRVNSILMFAHLDLENAKKIIATGKPMNETQRSEFALKAMSPERIKAARDSNAADLTNEQPPVGANAEELNRKKEVDAFEASVKADLGLTKVHEKKGIALVQQ